MDDLISRQAAIDAINHICPVDTEYDCTLLDRVDVRYVLLDLPSAQPEIIRCKDCKHYVVHTLFDRSQGWCERLCDEFDKSLARGTEEDDFCSRGERKDEEIQNFKLENDRLKRRNELMEDYIHALACNESMKSKFHGLCDNTSCPYYDHDKGVFEGACKLGSRDLIEKEAADLIDKLEEL